jgi:hypothetical protein
MGSGFIRFNSSESARGAARLAGAVPGILFAFAMTAAPLRVADAGTPASAVPESRPASVAVCTEPQGVDGPALGLAPLWTLGLPGAPGTEQSSLQIELDPETGTWGIASPARRSLQMPAEAAALSRISDDLVEQPLPGGGVMVDLRGRFQTLALAGRTTGGGVHFGCAEHSLGLFEWLGAEAPVLDAAGRPVK